MPIPKNKKQKANQHIAVVDIGSNSVRLVIYERIGQQYSVVKDKKVTCRLALGLTAGNLRLNRRGMKLALQALHQFRVILEKYKNPKILAIATAAMRIVAHTNQGQSFHRKAEQALGHKIKIISGRQEARLTAYGVMSGLPTSVGICGDLGGGSLELASINKGQIIHTATLALGTLTLLSETKSDPIAAENIATQRLQKVSWLEPAHGKTFYAIGGSWRAVGRVMMKKLGVPVQPIHGFTLKAEFAKILALAIAMQKPSAFKRMQPKISQRADVIPMAAATLAKLIECIQPRQIIFSGHGLREGVVRQGSR